MSIVKLNKFEIVKQLNNETFEAVATVIIAEKKGFFCRGIYNIITNSFYPNILGDPYEIEDYYDDIQEAVRNRT